MAGARIGQSLERVEDFSLLTGRGRYADDLPVAAGTLHAAILRSPHAHAEILAVDTARALAMPGVACILTGEDARRWTRPFIAAVKSPVEHWCLATGRVRYQGEPVAVVVAGDRYRAEDALEAIEVTYRPLPATLDPRAATGNHVVSDRRFRYGDPEAAFAAAAHRIAITTEYPRNGCTPIECFVVVAEHFPGEDAYEFLGRTPTRSPPTFRVPSRSTRLWRRRSACRRTGCGSRHRRIRAAVLASSRPSSRISS